MRNNNNAVIFAFSQIFTHFIFVFLAFNNIKIKSGDGRHFLQNTKVFFMNELVRF